MDKADPQQENDFDDFLEKRLQDDEEDELEKMLGDELPEYNSSDLFGASDLESRFREMESELNTALKSPEDVNTNVEDSSSKSQKIANVDSSGNAESANSSNQSFKAQENKRSFNNSSSSLHIKESRNNEVTIIEWNEDDYTLDANDSLHFSFQEKFRALLKHVEKEPDGEESRLNGISSSVNIFPSGVKRVGTAFKNVVGSAVGNVTGSLSGIKNVSESAQEDTMKSLKETQSPSDATSQLVETKVTIWLSDLLSSLSNIVKTPDPEILAKKKEESNKSIPGFDTLRQSLRNKLILLECTMDNLTQTINECVNRNLRLGKQNEQLRSNLKYIKKHYLEQQRQIQERDREIVMLREKLQYVTRVANNYRSKLESFEKTENFEEGQIDLPSQGNESNTSSSLVTSVNSLISWIGKKEPGANPQPSNQVQNSSTTSLSNSTSLTSWFKRQS